MNATMTQSLALVDKFMKDPVFNEYLADTGLYVDWDKVLNMWLMATESASQFEIIDANELAKRLAVPVSWIREMCRTRCEDPLPHMAFGRYKRFRWNSPELNAWLDRRKK